MDRATEAKLNALHEKIEDLRDILSVLECDRNEVVPWEQAKIELGLQAQT